MAAEIKKSSEPKFELRKRTNIRAPNKSRARAKRGVVLAISLGAMEISGTLVPFIMDDSVPRTRRIC
jgi:hypothetical protein